MARLSDLPFLVILMGVGALAMFVPVAVGIAGAEWAAARSFFYAGLIFLVLTALIGIATVNNGVRNQGRSHLLAMLGFYTLLPLMLAVPMTEAVPGMGFLDAYFEMVSCLTTTGATVFDGGADPGATVHVWRALVGWLGGFFLWVTAIAILAPMNLGGFEVAAAPGGVAGRARPRPAEGMSATDSRERLVRFATRLAPVYIGLTASLWVLMLLTGEGPLVAACHAMAVLSTSGISPVGGVEGGASGLWGEFMLFWFFAFAISRRTFMFDFRPESWRGLWRDLEFRMGIAIAWLVTAFLIARHWLGAYETAADGAALAALKSLWGAVFTVTSFLTTTGFTSSEWSAARAWAGLPSPGLILVGLAVFGGGVATTAGGSSCCGSMRFTSMASARWKSWFIPVRSAARGPMPGGSGDRGRRSPLSFSCCLRCRWRW